MIVIVVIERYFMFIVVYSCYRTLCYVIAAIDALKSFSKPSTATLTSLPYVYVTVIVRR